MSRFIVIRLLQMIAVVAIMSFVVYALIGLMPGDPIDLMISSNPHLSPADAVRLKALYGLDKPLIERYFAWARAALGGDFGYSRLYLQPVLNVLLPRLGNTAVLMGASLLCAYALALPLGILAARRPGSAVDGAVNLLAFAGISVPSFWLALMLILVFAATLGWLPAGGVATIGDGSLPDRVRHLVLPATTLTLVSMGAHLRYIRAAMIETLRQDYIRTRQRRRRVPRARQPRAAQRADPGGDRAGFELRQSLLRRAHHRDDVRLSRDGQAHLRFDPRQ
jgi:peptide/nickel transport system permease protein